jgi:hypothetical protein
MADAEAAGEDAPIEAAQEVEAEEGMNPMERVLEWIGFTVPGHRNTLLEEIGYDLQDFLETTQRELESLAKILQSRTPVATRVPIGLRKLRHLKACTHWAKDRDRLGLDIKLEGLDNLENAKSDFLKELTASRERAIIRSEGATSRLSRAKEASPGTLKDEKNWVDWESGLQTLFSIQVGVNGVPLAYVIREEDHVDGTVYPSFVEECVARARLDGTEFAEDARTVHQIIQSLTVGENAAHWLKDDVKKRNGRLDMIALRSHFRGAGNQSRRINQANHLQEKLHYKNERAMRFSDFISKVKEMFNIFADCGEPHPESAKLRFLWERVSSPILLPTVDAMKAQLGQDETAWKFVAACDHLASQIPADGAPRAKFVASALDRSGTADAASAITNNGTISTRNYSKDEWWNLTEEERKQVTAARKKEGGSTRHKNRRNKGKSTKPKANKDYKALVKTVKSQGKTISALQLVASGRINEASSDTSSDSDGDNAGNAFGGRAAKKRTKKKHKNN